MATNTAVIAGATGIVGSAFTKHLQATGDWNIVTISRRDTPPVLDVTHVQVDLLDAEACRKRLGALSEATHVFYTSYAPRATPAEEVAPNLEMLVNLMEAVEPVAPHLAHVQLMQGTKWYGNHLGAFRTPAREVDARHIPPNFYYDQQDWIVDRQRGRKWSWSALRPHCIMGYSVGSPMSHLMVLSLYASISKELGLPLRFPGTEAAFSAMYNFTDARLLARAMEWAATTQACENEAFNMNNGEPDRWKNVWPAIAECFGMEFELNVQQVTLTNIMADKEPLWAHMCEKHGLQALPLSELVKWAWGDWAYATDFDQVSSVAKARKAGWTGILEASTMFRENIADLMERKIIPPAG